MGAGPWTRYAAPPESDSGPWSKYSQTPEQALDQQKNTSAQQVAEQLGIGALKGAGQTFENIGGLVVNPLYRAVMGKPAPPSAIPPAQNGAQQIGEFVGSTLAAAPVMAGAGALADASGLTGPLANAALKIGALGTAGAAISPPDQRLTGAAVGAGAEGVAQGISAAAPAMAETALGVGNKARAFGKTPGAAALSETAGMSPEAVYESAGQAIDQNAQQLKQLYANAKTPVSMKPALDILADARETALRQNNKDAIQAIDDIRNRLMKNVVTGKNMGTLRSASDALDLKRGIGESANWNPNIQTKGTRTLLKRVYGALDGELDRVAPQGADLNQKISSLIEVRNRADIESRNAGVIQNVAHRVAAHTGALTGAAAGGYAGYRADGPEGAIVGALGGAVIPELLSSPSAQMAAARLMGKAPQLIRPIAAPVINWTINPNQSFTLSDLSGK